jgi:RNA recognition motif-containing protein
MSKILYFGNLPFDTSAADLTKLVKPLANVISAHIGLDRKTHKSRGFGFVEVPDEAAQVVITALNGKQFHGRSLTVNVSEPRPSKREQERQAYLQSKKRDSLPDDYYD